jgi:hypothetical protein
VEEGFLGEFSKSSWSEVKLSLLEILLASSLILRLEAVERRLNSSSSASFFFFSSATLPFSRSSFLWY